MFQKKSKTFNKKLQKSNQTLFFCIKIISLYRLMNLLILSKAKYWNSSKPFWEYLFIRLPMPFFWNSVDACPGMEVASWYQGNIFTLSYNTRLGFRSNTFVNGQVSYTRLVGTDCVMYLTWVTFTYQSSLPPSLTPSLLFTHLRTPVITMYYPNCMPLISAIPRRVSLGT